MSEQREHHLKTWPSAFEAVKSDFKPWEYRRNDRDFAVGDVLVLEWWDPAPDPSKPCGSVGYESGYFQSIANRWVKRRVTYIIHGGQFGIPDGYCVMTTEPTP